jgi:hypothetical protein
MVQLKTPVQEIYNEYLDPESYKNTRLEPFPKSSMIREETKGGMKSRGITNAVYFLTRDMKFKAYNITNYLDTGIFNLIYEV